MDRSNIDGRPEHDYWSHLGYSNEGAYHRATLNHRKRKRVLLEMQGGRCAITGCQLTIENSELDHIVPMFAKGNYMRLVGDRYVLYIACGLEWNAIGNTRVILRSEHGKKCRREQSGAKVEYYSHPENRIAASSARMDYFRKYPEARKALSDQISGMNRDDDVRCKQKRKQREKRLFRSITIASYVQCGQGNMCEVVRITGIPRSSIEHCLEKTPAKQFDVMWSDVR